jgi:hypothetical protein
MRWRNESLRPVIFPFINAKEIIHDAYYESFINWNVYQKALARIESNKNGSWMFVQENEKNDYWK